MITKNDAAPADESNHSPADASLEARMKAAAEALWMFPLTEEEASSLAEKASEQREGLDRLTRALRGEAS